MRMSGMGMRITESGNISPIGEPGLVDFLSGVRVPNRCDDCSNKDGCEEACFGADKTEVKEDSELPLIYW